MACCDSRSKCFDGQDSNRKPSGVSRLMAWMGGNSIRIDAAEAAKKLKEISPTLLQDGEEVDMAFKCERDHFYFTTYRILLRYKRGLTGARVLYQSVPYASIKAFTVQSVGQYFDSDSELSVWASGVGHIQMHFVKDMVDPFQIQRYFNCKVLSEGKVDPGDVGVHIGPGATANPSKPPDASDFWNMLLDDTKQVDAGQVEKMFKSSPSILEKDEQVQLAFKCGTDFTLFTTKRFLLIDFKGFPGKKIAYRTMLWKTFRAFSVETAGGFLDRDAEVCLWTNIKEIKLIRQQLRKGRADVFAVQKFLSNMLLGLDTKETSQNAASVSAAGQTDQGTTSLFEWVGDDMRQIDEKQVDAQLHSSPPILQGCESVEMAFKGRDIVLFTTKRLLIVDPFVMVKKVKYVTVPWTTVKSFAVRTAGSFMDKDCEMFIWTDIMFDPQKAKDPNEPQHPEPGMAMLEKDFSKDKVDLMAIHRYLSERCLQVGRDASSDAAKAAPLPVKPEILAKGPRGGAEKLLNWLGQDARQIDPKELDEQMHSVDPMLQSDEHVVMAFKVGRDTAVLTGKRWITMDVQGFSGAKVMYRSVPLTSVRAFSVETAGSSDRDAEVKLYTIMHWDGVVCQDLRKGLADVGALQGFLSSLLFGNFTGVLAPLTAPVEAADDKKTGAKDILAFLGQDFAQIDAAQIDKRFHTSPAILLDGETVDAVFKVGLDLFLMTDRRLLDVNVHFWTGEVDYKSVPLRFCTGCLVQSAGMFDMDAESAFFTDVPGLPKISKDLRQGKVDIYGFEKAAVAKVLKNASFKEG